MENLTFSEKPTSIEKKKSWQIFDQIAATYDITNRVLSMRQDVLWRKKLSKLLPIGNALTHLDLATGTGDQILHLLKVVPKDKIAHSLGTDLSEEMLKFGRKKIASQNLSDKIELRTGDATQLPLENNMFDVATMSFGIRNVPDVSKCLSEIFRVLKPNGRALILEFSLPNAKALREAYLFYFRKILPRLGGALSGHTDAYKYLNNSVEDFPYGDEFLKLMTSQGFSNVRAYPLTFGIASIYVGDKQLT